jgi:hypothetical protein
MTPEQKAHAQELWPGKLTVAEIAHEVGVGVGAIQHLADRNRDKFPPRVQVKGLDPDKMAEASRLWHNGRTALFIANALGVTKKQVDNAVRADRRLFPRRNETKFSRLETFTRNYERNAGDGIKPNTMLFTTSWGYQCIMPRVSILERA